MTTAIVAEQPELLADRGEDEVGRDVGDLLRVARARARCPANPPLPNANRDCTSW